RLFVEEHLERQAWRKVSKVRLDPLDQGGDHLGLVVLAGVADEQVERLDPFIPEITSFHGHTPVDRESVNAGSGGTRRSTPGLRSFRDQFDAALPTFSTPKIPVLELAGQRLLNTGGGVLHPQGEQTA